MVPTMPPPMYMRFSAECMKLYWALIESCCRDAAAPRGATDFCGIMYAIVQTPPRRLGIVEFAGLSKRLVALNDRRSADFLVRAPHSSFSSSHQGKSMVLQAIGLAIFFATMWAAVQFEGDRV
jgi:hypothetical protein